MLKALFGRPLFRSRRHAIAVAVGMILGIVFGDQVFSVVETFVGDPADEVVFAILGACLASVGYEIVARIGSLDQPR